MSTHWTEAQTKLARIMLAADESNAAFMEQFGKTKAAALTRVARLDNHPKVRRWSNTPTAGSARPTPQALADAERRLIAPRSLTAEVFRDPPPGYSALDRKQSGAST